MLIVLYTAEVKLHLQTSQYDDPLNVSASPKIPLSPMTELPVKISHRFSVVQLHLQVSVTLNHSQSYRTTQNFCFNAKVLKTQEETVLFSQIKLSEESDHEVILLYTEIVHHSFLIILLHKELFLIFQSMESNSYQQCL